MGWGKCKLCGETRLLVRSHIIPDFMHKELVDEINRIAFVSLKDFTKGQYLQSGIFDKGILCNKCDNERIGSLEGYASSVLYGGNRAKAVKTTRLMSNDGINSLRISNLDYGMFKLFILSILWHAHHSKHKFFKNIHIGEHENSIREMLIAKDPRSDQ